jgi:Ferritin-like domain
MTIEKGHPMHPEFTLEEVDRDGAIQEAIDKVSGDSRAGFLTKAALATGGLIGGGAVLGALASPAAAATKNDVAIANFALTLEYLEAEFYTEAVRRGALRGRTLRFARVVGAHERAPTRACRASRPG